MSHVKITTSDNLAWCDATLGNDFYFRDAEAAALNSGVGSGERTVCGRCLDNIMRSLDSNTRDTT